MGEWLSDKMRDSSVRKIPIVHAHKSRPGDLLSDGVPGFDVPDDDAIAIFVSSERGQQAVARAEGQVDHL